MSEIRVSCCGFVWVGETGSVMELSRVHRLSHPREKRRFGTREQQLARGRESKRLAQEVRDAG